MKILVKKDSDTISTKESKNPIWIRGENRIKIFCPRNELLQKGKETSIKTGISLLWPEGLRCYIAKEIPGVLCPTFINKSDGLNCEISKEIEVLVYNPFSFNLEIQKDSSLCDVVFIPSVTGISFVEDFLGDFSVSFLEK